MKIEEKYKKHIAELRGKLLADPSSLENLSSYEILNIPANASEKEIRKAYIKLVKMAHPDKKEEDNTISQALTNAYRHLTQGEAGHEKEGEEKDILFTGDDLNDYLLDPDETKIVPYDPDKLHSERGEELIRKGYTPYINLVDFFQLDMRSRKKLSVLLGKQNALYRGFRTANQNDTASSSIDTHTIDYDSLDLDSEYLSDENQKEIIALSRQATVTDCSSLFSNFSNQAALTTEVVLKDAPNLYISGWLLIHNVDGISSGARDLFLGLPIDNRKKIAIEIGNAELHLPNAKNNLIYILLHYRKLDPDKFFNDWLKVERNPGEAKEDWEDRVTEACSKIQKDILIQFAQELPLEKLIVPKKENAAEEIELDEEGVGDIASDCMTEVPVPLKEDEAEDDLCNLRSKKVPVPLQLLADEGQEGSCNIPPDNRNKSPMSPSFFKRSKSLSPPSKRKGSESLPPPSKRSRMGLD